MVLDRRSALTKLMHFKRSKVVPHEPSEKLSFAYSKGKLPISFAPLSFSLFIVNRLLPMLAAWVPRGRLCGVRPPIFFRWSSWQIVAKRFLLFASHRVSSQCDEPLLLFGVSWRLMATLVVSCRLMATFAFSL